jgi:hypothetical protein
LLTQTPVGRNVPSSVALVVILLLVGIGIMASARSINDSRTTRRVVRDSGFGGGPGYVAPPARVYEPPTRVYDSRYATDFVPPPGDSQTVVEERRMD